MFKSVEALILDANTGNTKQLSGRETVIGTFEKRAPGLSCPKARDATRG